MTNFINTQLDRFAWWLSAKPLYRLPNPMFNTTFGWCLNRMCPKEGMRWDTKAQLQCAVEDHGKLAILWHIIRS